MNKIKHIFIRFGEIIDKIYGVMRLRGDGIENDLWMFVAKVVFIPKRLFTVNTNMGNYLLRDAVVRNKHGLFYCRNKTSDLGTISDSFETMIAKTAEKSSGIFVDCGAYIGKYSVIASKSCDMVIAIEADSDNYSVLERNVNLNSCSNVKIMNCAVWENDGQVRLKKTRTCLTSFIDRNDRKYRVPSDGSVVVDSITLESLMKKADIDFIDWLKIDIEGAEYEVLTESEAILSGCNMIGNIILELHRKILGDEKANSLLSFIEDCGYMVSRISGDYYLCEARL